MLQMRFSKIVFMVLFITLFSIKVFAATEISGDVSDNTTGPWVPSKSPYVLTDSIKVLAGQTLTIQPGVEVRVNKGLIIQVSGSLIARGVDGKNITFTSNEDQVPGWWVGISVSDKGYLALEFCRISYAGDGLGAAVHCANESTADVTNCSIANVNGSGVLIRDNSKAWIMDTVFKGLYFPVFIRNDGATLEALAGNMYEVRNYGILFNFFSGKERN